MADTVAEIFRELDFYELHEIFLNSNYYEILFPFLLSYAVLFSVLPRMKVFQNKHSGEPYKAVVVLVSLIVSFFAVSFDISPGHTLGSLLMVMFPNISALTIGILVLYIVAALFGKNFFQGMFSREHGAYLYLAVGVIGLGSVIFYVGIALGFWDMNPLDPESHWNTVLAVAFLIMGVVFLIIDLIPFGLIFLMVFGAFVFNSGGTGSILEYFIDPVIFIIIIFIFLFSWVNSDKNKKDKLEESIRRKELNLERYRVKDGVTKDYQSPIRDIIIDNLERDRKKYERIYGKN